MNKQQNKKKSNNIVWIILAAILIIFLVQIGMAPAAKPTISLDTFYEKIGADARDTDGNITFDPANNQIQGIYGQGSTFYIIYEADFTKLTLEQQQAINENPGLIKTYASVTLYDSTNIVPNIVAEYLLVDNTLIYVSAPLPVSWTDYVIQFIYLILILGVLFMVWRGLSGRNGLSAMTQNRATVVFNGPTRFTDVAGIEEEKEQVAEIVDFLKSPKKYIDMGARIPKGVLLVGAPGTGKTLLAKAIAGEAGVPFFSLSGSDFSEMIVGVGPARMRDLFEQAKANAPAIIFLDEIDSIARMRGVGTSGVAEENEQTLNQLLVQMDGFSKSEGVIVFAATNRPDILDPAILRPGRFDRQIVVQMPDVKGREQILRVHAKNKPLSDDVDLNRVAKITSGFSGADLENLLNEGAIISAKDNRNKISMQDLLEALNKVLLGPQKKSRIITDKDKKITAYHEAGHAIISKVLMPDQTVQEISIIPRGMAAGYTLTNDQDNEHHHQSLSLLKNKIVMLLGGRCAEELFLGDICTGASNDIKVATNLAESMVTKWGMSEKLGPLFYGKEDEMALRLYNSKQVSESLQSVIDSEIKTLVTDALAKCKKVLSEHSAKVKVMANVLLSNETIYADDIELIMRGDKEQDIINKITERQQTEIKMANDNRANALVEKLTPILERSMEIALLHKEEKLVTQEHITKLEENIKLAKDYAQKTMEMPPIPTIDFKSLEEYPAMIKTKLGTEDKPKETEKATKPQPKTRKKTTKSKDKEEKNETKTPDTNK